MIKSLKNASLELAFVCLDRQLKKETSLLARKSSPKQELEVENLRWSIAAIREEMVGRE
jgi:hypothetical protein